MVFYVSLRMSARSRRVQVRGGSAKAVVGRKGRYRAIGEYMTALLLCRTATTGKRGGRQGESTTWVESSSVNVGCGSCWGAGVWRGSDLETQRLKAAGCGESRLVVVQRDNTPSPRVQNDKRGVPLCAASPPSAFLPSHREDMLDMNLSEWTFRQRL
jgi:hypothetical protein